jgi:hypothetical protein
MPEPVYMDMAVHPRHLREIHEEARAEADPTPEEREKIEASISGSPSHYTLFYRGNFEEPGPMLATWTPAHRPPEGSEAAHYLRYCFLGGRGHPRKGSGRGPEQSAKTPTGVPEGSA